MKRLPVGPIVVIILAIAAYFSFIKEYETITRTQAAYATLVVVLGGMPLLIRAIDKREASVMPLMALGGLFYALTFGLPIYSSKMAWRGSDENSITTALLLTNAGLLSLYLGYYATRSLYSIQRPLRLFARSSASAQIRIAWVIYVMSLGFEFVPALRTLPSVGQLADPLEYLSLGILFVIAIEKRLALPQRLMLMVAIGFTVAVRALSGFLAAPIFVLVFLGVLYWNHTRRIPWHFVVTAASIAIVLNPVKGAYRQNVWYSDTPVTSYIDKARLFYEAVHQQYSDISVATVIQDDTTTMNRLSNIVVFGVVVRMTPDSVPYWAGESYKTLWTSLIPRVLYPDKPQATIGQEFGHRYYLLDDNDRVTSMNLPWLPEFYANFGTTGVLLGMLAVGMLFRFLVERFNVPQTQRIEYVLGATITFTLFYAESNFSLMFGGVLLTYLALLVLLRLLTGSRMSSLEQSATFGPGIR